ncbi:MAG: carboxypeptidase-like regulatory domain-containing protein [Bryobacteraceae bacterium]
MFVRKRGSFSPFGLAMGILMISSSPSWSQSTATGTVSGQVVDAQKAVVAGTEVKLLDPTTNKPLTTTTNNNGRYIFLDVSPGTYNLTFNKTGFSVYQVNGQVVNVGEVLTINAALDVGATSTTVEVNSVVGAELQTSNSTVGSTINSDSMLYLPNLGREATTLALFQPGVSPEGSVAGAIYDQNTFQLDGANNSDDMDGSANVYNPRSAAANAPTGAVPTPIESVEEFKISTSGQTADFNGSSGSQVQMATKRGSNAFHGAGYEFYYASDVGAANNWDANHTPSGNLGYTPLPITHNNRFGGALGGPLVPKNFLGGKWYFFVNYEGFRFPQSSIIERTVPTALLDAGVIQITEGSAHVPYNLNPNAVTVGGVIYQPAVCPAGSCDPRGIGLNSLVSQIWNKEMPAPNVASGGDHYNTQGFQGSIGTPLKSNSEVARIDHDFNDKWRFMTSYRYYRYVALTTNQVDIGGALPGDKLGQPAAQAPRPLIPSYWVAGLTTNINATTTNDFRFSYLRNFWQWGTAGAVPQLPGLGAALEIGGESTSALIPYNVNNQNVRQRFWDGQDKAIRDDITKIKGNHLISFGGQYQRNFDYHLRTDNGGGIMNQPVDQIGPSSGTAPGMSFSTNYIPAGVPSSQYTTYEKLYEEVLGIVTQPQMLFTRSGPQLTLNPPGTPMFDQSTIPSYNLYFTDTWHMKPSFTLTYGLGYTLEMPPVERNGKQIELTDTNGKPIAVADYMQQRQAAALAGQVYNPTLAYTNIGNVTGASKKYPYNPFYGGLSPRVSAAWNPHFQSGILGALLGDGKTVIRGGYGRIFSRLNGVGLVLIPLLGVGLGQPVACVGASSNGQCLGNGAVTPQTAFRIGTDGLTAPLPAISQTLTEPFVPGFNGNAAAGAGSVLDPNFRPARTDNVTISIQRELGHQKAILEVGYIGRIIRNEWQQINFDAVPTMTTLGGQSFAQAFAATYWAIAQGRAPAPQAFFESALGGANSAFCKGFGSCTAAIAQNSTMNSQIAGTQVYDFWAALNSTSSWTLGRTMPSSPINGGSGQVSGVFTDTSNGYGNYNAGYLSLTTHDWHGVTLRSNLTYGRALGTGNQVQATSEYTVLDPWNMHAMYGPQYFDYKFIYNLSLIYHPTFYRTQKGVAGHLLGGWTIAPLLTAHSGAPLSVYSYSGGCQSFGETNCSVGSSLDGAVLNGPFTYGNSAHFNQAVSESASANPNGVGVNANTDNGGQNVQMYTNPVGAFNDYRNCVLGYDTNCGSNGNIRGLPTWNVDATVSKDIGVWKEGRVGATLIFQFTNLFNHVRLTDPYLDITDPADFGVLGTSNPNGGQENTPRNMEFGLRIHF